MTDVFEARMTSKGQIVVPKSLRDRFNLNKGTKVKIVASTNGVLLVPEDKGPWTSLRGMMKDSWKNVDLDMLIEEAKRSLFKRAK